MAEKIDYKEYLKQFGKIEPKLRKTDGFMAFDVAMYCKDELEVQTIFI